MNAWIEREMNNYLYLIYKEEKSAISAIKQFEILYMNRWKFNIVCHDVGGFV